MSLLPATQLVGDAKTRLDFVAESESQESAGVAVRLVDGRAAFERHRRRTSTAARDLLRELVTIQQNARVHRRPVPDRHVVLQEQRARATLSDLRRLRFVIARAQRGHAVLRERRRSRPSRS